MVQISASLLAADYANLGLEVARAERAGVDSFHFDMMDGHYAPNIALAPQHLVSLRRHTRLQFIVHLELSNPEEVLNHFAPLEADAIVVMWDTLTDPLQIFAAIRAQGKAVGLSLNPQDSLAAACYLFPLIDILIILGVQPGFGGQPMHPGTVEKIAEAVKLIKSMGLSIPIQVDGGVNQANAPDLIRGGADILIIGTALFQARDIRCFVKDIKGFAVE